MMFITHGWVMFCRCLVMMLTVLCCAPAFSAGQSVTNRTTVVCVSAFEVNAGDAALGGMNSALSDLLQASLSQHSEVTVVDREHLSKLMSEHEVTVRGLSDPVTAARLGGLLGADKFINGSVMMANNDIVIVANVLDVRTSTVLASKKIRGLPANLADLSMELAGQLVTVLNIKASSTGEIEQQPMGSLHFLRGLGFYQSGNYDRALSEFMLCGDMVPDHPSYRYWIGLCYFQLKGFDHARIEFSHFLRDQPKSDKAEEAMRFLKECEDKLKDSPSFLSLLSGGSS